MNKSNIVVIIVNFNGLEDTIECIYSIKKSSVTVDIFVVDNYSSNDEACILKEKFDDIITFRSYKNLGFSGGNNIGIKWAIDKGYEYVLLLNNDTIIDAEMIENLLKVSDENTVAVPCMYYFNTPEMIWYGGGDVNRKTGAVIHYFENTRQVLLKRKKCTFATGCCLMLHKKILNTVGLLDDSYFMYFEDVDYSIRVIQNDFNIVMEPRAKLWHKIGMSSGGEYSPLSIYYSTRNRLYNIRKHKDFFLFSAYYYTLYSRIIKCVFKVINREKIWKLYLSAIKDYYHGNMGKVDIEKRNRW